MAIIILNQNDEHDPNQIFRDANYEIVAKWLNSFTLYKIRSYMEPAILMHAQRHLRDKEFSASFDDPKQTNMLTLSIDILTFTLTMIHEPDIDKIERELQLAMEEREKIYKEMQLFNYFHLNNMNINTKLKTNMSNSNNKKLWSTGLNLEDAYISDPANLYTIVRAIGAKESVKCFKVSELSFDSVISGKTHRYYLWLEQPLSLMVARRQPQTYDSSGEVTVEAFIQEREGDNEAKIEEFELNMNDLDNPFVKKQLKGYENEANKGGNQKLFLNRNSKQISSYLK